MTVFLAVLAVLAVAVLGLFLAFRGGPEEVICRGEFLKKVRLVSDEIAFPGIWADPNSLPGLHWSTMPVHTLVCFVDGRAIDIPGDIDIPFPPGTEIAVNMNRFGRFWVESAKRPPK